MPTDQISIVGGESLLGRELRDLLQDQPLPGRVQLLGADPGVSGILTVEEDEAALIQSLEKDHLQRSQVAFLAGTAESSQRAIAMIGDAQPQPVLVDLTYALEDQPNARLRAPQVEPAGHSVPRDSVHIVAHPAAVALAILFSRLQEFQPLERSVATIFEPASERGQQGLTELQQQTVGLLNFQSLNKDVFDTQAAFALLPRFGDAAPVQLADVEQRIERHLTTLLSYTPAVPLPSVRLVQAPVFHGYTVSIWAQFAASVDPGEVATALMGSELEVRTEEEEPPTNVSVAGQSGLALGPLEQDRNDPRAIWLWLATDNFRLSAETSLLIARGVLGA